MIFICGVNLTMPRGKYKRAKQSEEHLQKTVAQFLSVALPEGSIFHHSPNEGTRHVAFQMKLKAGGFKAGWPDLEIFCPNVSPIFIELKVGYNKQTERQKEISQILTNLGCHYAVCYDLDEVVNFLTQIVKLRVDSRGLL